MIRQLLVRLLAARVREVKLFYVLSGHETGDDFREFRTFLGWLRGERERHGKSPRLIFSFNRLTRMPFTPLAYDRLLLAEEDWEPLLAQARSAVEGTGGEFRLASAWPEYATAQVLALGGTWLAEPLLLLAGRGFCFDRELPPAAWTLLQNWLRERPELLAGLIAEKAGDHRFALGFVKAPVDAVTRYARYQEAAACLDSSPGPRLPPPRLAHLRHTHLQVRPELPAEVEALLRRKARLRPLYTALTVPREAAGASPEWLDAWCLRYLLAAYPELTDNLLDARQCLLGGQGARDRFPPWFGRALFALTAWDPEAVRAALGGAAGDPAAAPIESTAAPAGSAAVSWQRLELTLHLPARFFPRAGDRLLDYLVGEHAPATARREETGLRLEPGARALKKKLLLAGRALTTATGERLELAIGPRFNPRRYLERFPEPGSWRQALVEVHAFTIEAGGDILEPQCRDTPQPGS